VPFAAPQGTSKRWSATRSLTWEPPSQTHLTKLCRWISRTPTPVNFTLFDEEPFHSYHLIWFSRGRLSAKYANEPPMLDVSSGNRITFRDESFDLKLNWKCLMKFPPDWNDFIHVAPTKHTIDQQSPQQ
jgi:hypothetical protein